ncbi:putative photosynthetic complex assembly protein PuhE [Roseicella frigidaeris]|uniref:Photosynthetic complex assembly protein 2 n=1 Tax=Roseicella frigidaeris TaxID=2230885 RepID=A0A327M330_9PROT|nr:putative photosynthetic complex assembly protein PuhE [Roseicella frigidaeris]RAI57681.1 photosynthetic complex assembly protein 2 [Roseicella frigidaeris]
MLDYGLPALTALFLWWFSTGLILHLDGLRPETFRWSMAAATLLLLAALWGLDGVADDDTPRGAYLAFGCALLCWAWIELGFLTGWITGPRREALPPGATGWPRLRAALAAVLWHELAILGVGILVLAVCWGRPNMVGAWTFLVLWIMRTSAKLNLFLGVRNPGEGFLPAHLRYLGSYFARRPMNLLFPVSVTLGTLACAALLHDFLAPATGPERAAGAGLVATLLALGVLEHWFLVLPIPVEALWRWGLRSRGGAPARIASWDPGLGGPLDSRSLRRLLDEVAAGAFGQVESLRGVVRTGSGWIGFSLAGGRPRLEDREAGTEPARVVAIGRALDEARLRAAFAACARPAAP